ncbi:hypothetical protein [Halorussus salinus]|uniref:hypothetical protein n=1 Tax=Halorussus salinus TaxID=1364935 RepID=UPI0010925F09|nr:hypothetical protein [Halorussus salinus]
MRYTNYPPTLPTRTTLRTAATRTRDAASAWGVHALVAGAAIVTFAAGATAAVVALALLLGSLPGNPLALLAAAAAVVVTARTLPLLALYAARRAVRTLDGEA